MKLFHVISTAILGAAMSIGVGLAIANTQRAMKAEASISSDEASGLVVLTSSNFSTSAEYVLKSTDGYYYNGVSGTSSSKWGGITKTLSEVARLVIDGTWDDGFTIKNIADNTFLRATTGNMTWATTSPGTFKMGTDSESHPICYNGTTNGIKVNGTSGMRVYTNLTYNASTGKSVALYQIPVISTEPSIDSVVVNGSPAASSNVTGNTQWTMSATVTASHDPSSTLSRNVGWTVSPENAVTFSKTTSSSGENITVTASNNNYSNVKITATSQATGFTTVHGDSNQFNIIKTYPITSVTLSTITAGGPTYDAAGASSFEIGFSTSVNYTSEIGTNNVNITVSPTSGVSGYGDNKAAGNFNLTFTKSGTYTITSTAVENNEKSASVSVTVNNIVVPGYDLINSVGSLRNGAKLVLYSFAKQRILGNSAASSLRAGINLSVSEADADFIPSSLIPENTEIITLISSGPHWELKTASNKYLSLTSNANAQNISDSADTTNNTTEWDISFSGNNALIQSVAYPERYIECNSSNSNFGSYKGTQSKVQLYCLRNTDPYFSISQTGMYLGPRGTQTLTITAHNGASDTLVWSSSNTSVATVPASSTGMSVVVTGVAVGNANITATFSNSAKYEALVCAVEVLDLQPYVNVRVTKFTKTTSKPSGGWEGTYLIGQQEGKTLFDGSLSPLPGGGENYASFESLSNEISATSEMIAKSFSIKATATEGVYTIRSNSYYYIGNETTSNGMNTSIGEAFEVNISDDGRITSNGTALCYNTGITYRFFQTSSISDKIKVATLWRADGEMREITSTLASWYDNSKDYLQCNSSGTGSTINWTALYESAIDLSVADLDTLENMSAKSAEDSGNYLEDFISDYDYLVAVKGYDDFLGREAAGTLSVAKNSSISSLNNNNFIVVVIIIASVISVSTVGAIFLLRKYRKHN